MSTTVPSVQVFQEFTTIPDAIVEPLRACIIGPNAKLHRYTEDDEKSLISLGEYDYVSDTGYSWPDKTAGSKIDIDYTKVYIDKALLRYFFDPLGSLSTIAPVSGKPNRVRSSTLYFKDNGTSYPRSAVFYDRDVKVGDVVYIRGVDSATNYELNSYVTGFAGEQVNEVIGAAASESGNPSTQSPIVTVQQMAGTHNQLDMLAYIGSYSGLIDGYINDTYYIEVTKSSTGSDFTTAELRVTTASGLDTDAVLTPAAVNTFFAVGERGMVVKFRVDSGNVSSAAYDSSVDVNDLLVGQKWKVTVQSEFHKPAATSGGTYSGETDLTYIIEVTKGGKWSELPEITVTSNTGVDYAGPVTVTAASTAVAVGSFGVTASFSGSGITGLRKGDKYTIDVTARVTGRISTLILAHNLPTEIQDASDLDLKLYIKVNDLEIDQDRIPNPPLQNWDASATEITINGGIEVYESSWTDDGDQLALPIEGGTVYVTYREWLTTLCNEINGVADVGSIDTAIEGQLDPDNPLKYGVFKALTMSNATTVKFMGICDPDDLSNWTAAIALLAKTEDVHGLVPLTYDQEVLDLFAAHVNTMSGPTVSQFRALWAGVQEVTEKALVDATTTSDETVAMATLADDPDTSGTQYTYLTVPAGNANFVTNGVTGGDTVRYLYTTDAFGNVAYSTFTVEDVVSEDTLRLSSGHTVAVPTAQKVEVWRTLSATAQSEEYASQGGVYSNRRVRLIFPPKPVAAGEEVESYFMAATLAGARSGVAPHQPLTNVEILGYTDVPADGFSFENFNTMAEGGIWIVTTDRNGTLYTRRALTTSTLDLNHMEESIQANVDSVSTFFKRRLAPYIGRSNVTPQLIELLDVELRSAIDYLKGATNTATLGPQLIDATIRSIKQNSVSKDRVDIIIDGTWPAPFNVAALYLFI